jgi:hypothetical protein
MMNTPAFTEPRLRIIECDRHFVLDDQVLCSSEPILLKNLVAHWPVVKQAKLSSAAAAQYLLQFYRGLEVVEVQGNAELNGRFGYTADFAKLNCVAARKSFVQVLDDIFSVAQRLSPVLHGHHCTRCLAAGL